MESVATIQRGCCQQCGIPCSTASTRLCRSCYDSRRASERAARLVCPDCGGPVSNARAQRCRACKAIKSRRHAIYEHVCIDCGKRVSSARARRCQSCGARHRHASRPKPAPAPVYGNRCCLDCGRPCGANSVRCLVCIAEMRVRELDEMEDWERAILRTPARSRVRSTHVCAEPHCGRVIGKEDVYCARHGARVASGSLAALRAS